MSLKPFIRAARLRTLPLAAAGTIAGNLLALTEIKSINAEVFILSTGTALLLQILSNYANDYGDFKKGADGSERTDRMLASGQMSEKTMIRSIVILALCTLFCGIWLLFQAFQQAGKPFWLFLILGLAGIASAYFYTAGKKSYGYIGLGDLAVFIFFGPVAVTGCFFLQTGTTDIKIILAGVAAGLLSSAVLNVNNLRDLESDKQAGKKTIAVRLGRKGTLRYHLLLLFVSVVLLSISGVLNGNSIAVNVISYLLLSIVFGAHYLALEKCYTRPDFNKQLKLLSLLVLAFMLYFCIFIIYLNV